MGAVAFAAESPVIGKWQCTNVQVTGAESPWTLLVRQDGAKLTGSLMDGSVEIPLSRIKLDSTVFTFGFLINDKPYSFEGKVDQKTLEGKYSGPEANGTLRCAKP